MSNDLRVELSGIDKRFYTQHFFSIDPAKEKRRLYHSREVHAVNDVGFGIAPGEIFGLLGPNGAGKTTTVKILSGLIRPNSGTVVIEGKDVEKHRFEVLKQIGVVLEGTRTVIWPLTPLENLAYFGTLKAVPRKVLRERSHELLEFIGLSEKKDIQVRKLSRGQKQKLAICIALVADPSVILLDEPTTGLDVQSSRGIKDKLREMAREQGKSVLVTTHDMHVAQELCDRIGIIDQGKLVQCRTTDELVNLFSDQTYAMRLDRLPANGDIASIPGVIEVRTEDEEEGPTCIVRIEPEPEIRSAALYSVVESLKREGLQLRAINQQQATLENVFLQITSSTMEKK